jgi:hypothetical protein
MGVASGVLLGCFVECVENGQRLLVRRQHGVEGVELGDADLAVDVDLGVGFGLVRRLDGRGLTFGERLAGGGLLGSRSCGRA